jgi:hypothetical protein
MLLLLDELSKSHPSSAPGGEVEDKYITIPSFSSIPQRLTFDFISERV